MSNFKYTPQRNAIEQAKNLRDRITNEEWNELWNILAAQTNGIDDELHALYEMLVGEEGFDETVLNDSTLIDFLIDLNTLVESHTGLLDEKVDKIADHSLVPDAEISKLEGLDDQDTLDGKFAGKADVDHGHDASDVTSGVFDLARIPQAALERLYNVNDEEERFALTTADVQNGDTVKQLDTEIMYRVVDQTKLNEAAGYVKYSAGRAAAVPWSGVEDKPETFPPAEHDHDEAYAALGHDHDEAYAALGHDHDEAYAALGHDHDDVYEPADASIQSHLTDTNNPHGITPAQIGASPDDHDHDEDYADIAHVHDNAVPTGTGQKDGFMSHQDKKKLNDIDETTLVNTLTLKHITDTLTELNETTGNTEGDFAYIRDNHPNSFWRYQSGSWIALSLGSARILYLHDDDRYIWRGTYLESITDKVDKVEGKGLSDENFTNAEKTKLANIDPENIPLTQTLVTMQEIAPMSASDGDVYYNTSTNRLHTWEEGTWGPEQVPNAKTFYSFDGDNYTWDGTQLTSITTVDLTAYIKKVNGETPDAQGEVTVPLAVPTGAGQRSGTITHQDKAKLNSVETGAVAAGAAGDAHAVTAHAPSDAQKNVNPDWNATEGDAQILNKPAIPENTDTQADWNETDTESPAFIQHKPTIPTVPTISTDIETDRSDDTKTASPKAVGDFFDAQLDDLLVNVIVFLEEAE